MMNNWPRKRRVITLGAGLALVLVGFVSIGYLPLAQGASLDALPPSQNLAQLSFAGYEAIQPAVNSPPDGGEAWEEMHQACENGDYEAMAQGHDRWHGEESSMGGDMMGGEMMDGAMMGSGTWNGGMMGGMGSSMGQGMMSGMGRVTSQ